MFDIECIASKAWLNCETKITNKNFYSAKIFPENLEQIAKLNYTVNTTSFYWYSLTGS